MGKSAVKSKREMLKALGSSGAPDGYLVPIKSQPSAILNPSSAIDDGLMVPNRQKPGHRAYLDGNSARRKLPIRASEYCIWDTELAGVGLRVRPTGRTYWFVRLRHRTKHRRIPLGQTDEVDAALARTQARRLLAEVALDGLPDDALDLPLGEEGVEQGLDHQLVGVGQVLDGLELAEQLAVADAGGSGFVAGPVEEVVAGDVERVGEPLEGIAAGRDVPRSSRPICNLAGRLLQQPRQHLLQR